MFLELAHRLHLQGRKHRSRCRKYCWPCIIHLSDRCLEYAMKWSLRPAGTSLSNSRSRSPGFWSSHSNPNVGFLLFVYFSSTTRFLLFRVSLRGSEVMNKFFMAALKDATDYIYIHFLSPFLNISFLSPILMKSVLIPFWSCVIFFLSVSRAEC